MCSATVEGIVGTSPEYYEWRGLSVIADQIPDDLRYLPQWVLWKAEPKPAGGMSKIPYQPTGWKASSTDPTTWSDLPDVVEAYCEDGNDYAGIGIVLTKDDDFFGGDFDHCRNPATGKLTDLAQRIVDSIATYWEVSPSGTGMRFIARGGDSKSFRGTGIEIYSSGRYLTITGHRLSSQNPSQIPQAHVDRLRELAHGRKSTGQKSGQAKSPNPADDAVVKALKAHGLYQRELQDGRHQITCPWAHEHTGGDLTGSVYMAAHYNGYSEPQYTCQHTHGDRFKFRELLGFLGVPPEAVLGKTLIAPLMRHPNNQVAHWGIIAPKTAPAEAEVSNESPIAPVVINEGGAMAQWPPKRAELALSVSELESAQLAPKCIVEHYLYADLAQIIAPGGTGKTTLLLYESICICLGLPVWGMTTKSSGWVLFVTKEDQRARLAARVREIMAAMQLDDAQRATVMRDLVILDVTGGTQKLTFVSGGNIDRTAVSGAIIDAYRADPPVMTIFDPLASFGASEAMVNDNEQALVEVGRHIIKELDCCVRYVHHTGKANARAEKTDQYSGRGGTALPDGSRMTVVIEPWDGKEQMPVGCKSDSKSGIIKLHRHKMSYAPPNLRTIWVKRTGFAYEHYLDFEASPEARARAREEQMLRFITSRLVENEYHSHRSLEMIHDQLGLGRNDLRAALAGLEARGAIAEHPLPVDLRKGRRKTYLKPC